jgi:hypothetical protein
MTTKPKTRKAAVDKQPPISLSKIHEVHTHLQNAMNLLQLVELTARELADGEISGDMSYMFCIATATRLAVESIQTSYHKVDKFNWV